MMIVLISIIHCTTHLATRCNLCFLALTPEHTVKSTNQQDSTNNTAYHENSKLEQ